MNNEIIAVNKDPDGNIISVKTRDNCIYSLEQAINEVEKGNLKGVQVVDRQGSKYLRSYPDGVKKNNLDNLPSI